MCISSVIWHWHIYMGRAQRDTESYKFRQSYWRTIRASPSHWQWQKRNQDFVLTCTRLLLLANYCWTLLFLLHPHLIDLSVSTSVYYAFLYVSMIHQLYLCILSWYVNRVTFVLQLHTFTLLFLQLLTFTLRDRTLHLNFTLACRTLRRV